MRSKGGGGGGRRHRPPEGAGFTTVPQGSFQNDAAHIRKTCVFLSDKNTSLSPVGNPTIKFAFQI